MHSRVANRVFQQLLSVYIFHEVSACKIELLRTLYEKARMTGAASHQLSSYGELGFDVTISKTSASVSSGFPNTRKLMKARGRRPSAFIVFECLETPMKHEATSF